MGRGILSGLFWGGAASMIVLMAASVYFPLRDISDRTAPRAPVRENVLLADPPPLPPGAEVQPSVAEPEPPVTTDRVAAPLQTPRPDSGPPPDAPALGAPAVAEAPTAPPTDPAAPAGPGPELAETAPANVAQPAPGQAVPTAPGPDTPSATAPRMADAPPGLPVPGAVRDRAPGEALAALQTPLPVPEVAQEPGDLTAPAAILPAPGARQIGEAATRTPDRPADLPVPGTAAEPPVAPAPVAPPRPPELAAEPSMPSGPPEPVELARPDSPPPRLALAPADLPLPPVAAAPMEASEPPVPAAGSLPADPRPAADTPAPPADDRRTALVVPPRELPRRLVLGSDQSFGTRGPGLSSRIPRIGETAAVAEAEDALTPEPEVPAPLGALARNALPFEGAEGVPRLALVLRATSDARAITDVLSRIADPVAVALDPTWPEADARAAELRAAGHEVLITLTGLPDPVEPRDIDTALAVHIARLPGAMGVWLPRTSPVFDDRELLRHLVAVLADTGHGLVAPLSGLDAVGQEARAIGLPAISVGRVLGGSGEGEGALRRSLDQGALRAGADGQAVLLGETRAETLSALRDWSAAQDPDALRLAPISALLLAPGS
ncbi:divergent polysaccharide deacetylase family protein [Dinoroseobacter sp. PD6]|uniref:divergent polysaccharide deacetylase family protein n=1 Tax=Dinoroseobacter sp. PD6 TaxID=3028384 RepID=UPI00237BFFFD|nr:divergent polysaccharide deacetylase family protein [Dinoroseobacter sp. PD6]MDD9715361.1 divergent polysaccharide deacetylase family protein [Dinoroseobacter sp. PD6]